jgi:membrane protease YdiL (CAAX protease family)
MDPVIFAVSFAVAAGVVFLLAKPFDQRILVVFALGSAVYLGLDDFVTGAPSMVKGLGIPGADWNWSGKLLSLGLSILVIAALKLSPAAVGLTLPQRHIGIGCVALALFIVWGACLGLYFKPGAADTETLAFQAIMPGLSEELVYRGIAPALLLGLVARKGPVEGMPWAVILATAVVFGIWHGLRYSEGEFGFEVTSALFPFIGSIPGGWLRFKTGSLLFPILAHGLANVAFHVAGAVGS